MIFGLFLLTFGGSFAGCAPSRSPVASAGASRVFVEPPVGVDPLAEAAHDAFVRAMRQAGYDVPSSPDMGEIVVRLSFHPDGNSQALVVTLADSQGRILREVPGGFNRTRFWTTSLASDEARRLADRLGRAPLSVGSVD